MTVTDRLLPSNETALLRSLINKKLLALDAHIVARGDMAWNTVRLHFDNISVDVSNHLEELTVDEFGNTDEFGVIRIAKADGKTLAIPGVSCETTVIPIGKTVCSIGIAEETIEIKNNNETVSIIKYSQAIIFNFEDESLILDKEAWFDETLAIKAGHSPNALIYDDSVNWADDFEEDPTTHYCIKTETRSL